MLASIPNRCDQSHEFRSQVVFFSTASSAAGNKYSKSQQQTQQAQPASRWTILSPYLNSDNAVYASSDNQPTFDCYSSPQIFSSGSVALPMNCDEVPHYYSCRFNNGQDIPRTLTNAHHRDSSLSPLGSAGPVSPFNTNISNPQIAGDIFDFNDISSFSTPKILTPAQTPSQEALLVSHFSSNFQNSSNLGIDLMPISELSFPDRPLVAANSSHGSPTLSSVSEKEVEQEKGDPSTGIWMTEDVLSCDQGYKKMTRLDRTMNNIYEDNMYNPNVQLSPASSPSRSATASIKSSHNEIFEQRLQTANNQHIHASSQIPLVLPTSECTPFRHGSPLAPQNSFTTDSSSLQIGTVQQFCEQQKVENEAQTLDKQLFNGSTAQSTPTTISPKDVDLVYHNDGEESLVSLFPTHQKSQIIMPSYQLKQETIESNKIMTAANFGGMESTRCENSSLPQQTTQNQNNFNFTIPVTEENLQYSNQQFSFLQSRIHRKGSRISNSIAGFSVSQPSTKSRKSECNLASENIEIKKPSRVLADTGTYTCTYHGCTLRFDTPTRLQRHKRESHRSSSAAAAVAASSLNGIIGNGMTSIAQRNSQAGPHRCDRINPSTGKPCNTVFSRPYDLTRHEDTIHNTQKQKVYCHLCEEEKSFSRNDALTRHMRVVHPEYVDTSSRRRRGTSS